MRLMKRDLALGSLIEKDFNEAWFDNKAWVRSSLVQESHSCVWRALMTEKLASILCCVKSKQSK